MALDDLATPAQIAAATPGITVSLLAQLRFRGKGPRYYKPTPRKILYSAHDVAQWIQASQSDPERRSA